MKPIICPCGLEKELVKGIMVCTKHCDKVCENRTGCVLCGTYNITTNQRVTAEHAKEKSR